jgi:hypothetical protein
MAAPKTSPRPRGKPSPKDLEGTTRGAESTLAPETSPRPKKKPAKKAMGGGVTGYAKGGKCRGMGAAKRGGSYKG